MCMSPPSVPDPLIRLGAREECRRRLRCPPDQADPQGGATRGDRLRQAVETKDDGRVCTLGHNMKGTGSGPLGGRQRTSAEIPRSSSAQSTAPVESDPRSGARLAPPMRKERARPCGVCAMIIEQPVPCLVLAMAGPLWARRLEREADQLASAPTRSFDRYVDDVYTIRAVGEGTPFSFTLGDAEDESKPPDAKIGGTADAGPLAAADEAWRRAEVCRSRGTICF